MILHDDWCLMIDDSIIKINDSFKKSLIPSNPESLNLVQVLMMLKNLSFGKGQNFPLGLYRPLSNFLCSNWNMISSSHHSMNWYIRVIKSMTYGVCSINFATTVDHNLIYAALLIWQMLKLKKSYLPSWFIVIRGKASQNGGA